MTENNPIPKCNPDGMYVITMSGGGKVPNDLRGEFNKLSAAKGHISKYIRKRDQPRQPIKYRGMRNAPDGKNTGSDSNS